MPQKFEDIFAKYAGGDKQGITFGEVTNYMKGQRLYADPIGWSAAAFECEWCLLIVKAGKHAKGGADELIKGSRRISCSGLKMDG